MILFQPVFLKEANEANAFLVGCAETKETVLVDAGSDSPAIDEFLRKHHARLTGIVITHLHWDHDGGLDSILQRHDVPVYSLTGRTVNGKAVAEGDTIPLGKRSTRILKTTGHTADSLSLIVDNRMAFVGDAIFAGSIGGTSSESAKNEEIRNIREKLFTLPESTLLCTGHGPMTTVGIEKNSNPFFV